MKQLIFMMLLASALTQCKDKSGPDPLPEISSIVGSWRMVETQSKSGDSVIVTTYGNEPQPTFEIRYDGVILHNGFGSCCPSTEYVVNGKPFKVEPRSDIPFNVDCGLVYCGACPKLEITQSGNEMTITGCNQYVTKYIRIK